MPTYSVRQAMTHFSRLLNEATAGEEVLISRRGKIIARILPDMAKAAPPTPRPFDAR